MKLLIIRHGDPDYAIDSLTPTGWKEAEALSRRISRLDVKAFYCSPLGRARDTAKATLEAMGREAEVLPWLREFGPPTKIPGRERVSVCWDWLPQDWTKHPPFYALDSWTDSDWLRHNGLKEEYQRVAGEMDSLLASHGYTREGNYYRADKPNEDTIVLFCHYGVTIVLLSHLLGISPMPLWHGFCAAPTSVTTLVTEERRKGIAYFRVNGYGDTSHLYAAGMEPSFSARFCETYDNLDQRHD